jgi:HEAT repeat protein
MGNQLPVAVFTTLLVASLLCPVSARAGDESKEEEPKETAEQIERAERLGKMLESRNKLEVTRGLELLGELKTPTAGDLLMDFIRASKNVEHSTYAIRALGWKGNKRAVDFLCGRDGLRAKNILLGEASARALREIADRRAIPSLIEAIKGKKYVVVAAAIEAVVHLDPDAEGLADLMIKKARDRDDMIRMSVATAMGTLEDPKILKPLMKLAERDGNALVRENACRSLGRIADPKAMPVLEKILRKDMNQNVRGAAREAYDRCEAKADSKEKDE